MALFQGRAFRTFAASRLRHQIWFITNCRAYSSPYGSVSEADELEAAREWYRGFKRGTIPAKIGETSFSRSSGPGGQKVNKTSSKATTMWPLRALCEHVPKALHQGLRDSRYYVSSSDALAIQCDTGRSQTANREETHARLHDEITLIYKNRVPGITSPEQKKRIEALKKSENTVRLKIKKMHGEKKRARSGGGQGD